MPRPSVTLSEGTVEYEVERILQQRTRRRRLEYLVKCKSYRDTENSWVPRHDIKAPALLAAFCASGTA